MTTTTTTTTTTRMNVPIMPLSPDTTPPYHVMRDEVNKNKFNSLSDVISMMKKDNTANGRIRLLSIYGYSLRLEEYKKSLEQMSSMILNNGGLLDTEGKLAFFSRTFSI